MSLAEHRKICCRAVGREKREMSALTDTGVFLLFNASQESFPYGEPFQRKSWFSTAVGVKTAIYLCSFFL